MKLAKLLKRYRIDDPDRFRLSSYDCGETGGFDSDEAESMLDDDVKRLRHLQELLFAQEQWAVLIVLQGMDAAGKDSIVSHVMSGVNPQGCDVHSFKTPSTEELGHDFLWRTTVRLPMRGRIGIFNRSHYEEVLAVRVHPEFLERQKIPGCLVGKRIWKERFQDIRSFERHLARNGVLMLKFFLHVSKEEQRRRFLDRLEEPAKRWKFSMSDVAERALWDKYMSAYQEMIRATSRPHGPWYVVPADHKWFARLIVAAAVIDALDGLDLHFPEIKGEALEEMQRVRKALLGEAPSSGRHK
jgi:PPK2 family polyphosphate:nucleotide phosphotransferase